MRRDRFDALERPWFAGGTVTIASVQGDGHYLHPDEAGVRGRHRRLPQPARRRRPGCEHLERVGRRRDPRPGRLPRRRGCSKRSPASATRNGRPVVEIHGPTDIVAARRHGDVPAARPVTVARSTTAGSSSWPTRPNISLRTGCFCNPGAGEIAHGLGAREMTEVVRARRADVVPRAPRPTCWREHDVARRRRPDLGRRRHELRRRVPVHVLHAAVSSTARVDEIGGLAVRVRPRPGRSASRPDHSTTTTHRRGGTVHDSRLDVRRDRRGPHHRRARRCARPCSTRTRSARPPA